MTLTLAAGTSSGVPPAVVRYVAGVAGRAPSVHNTQPWRFFYADGGTLELHADPRRQLPQSDPTERELHISCGAALFGMRLAIRNLGYQPIVRSGVALDDRTLLARLRYGVPTPPTSTERSLLLALSRRHTHRDSFSDEPISATTLAALQRVVESEHAGLVFVSEPAQRQRLARLVSAGERTHHRSPTLRRELMAWTRPPGSSSRDGVLASAYPQSPPQPGAGELASRDFALGRPWGRPPRPGSRGAPALAILTTASDTRADWLRAGQALHRLLLAAAAQSIYANLHTQPLQLPHLRAVLRQQICLAGYPQMVLSMGRADRVETTARRAVSDTLAISPAAATAEIWLE